METTLQQIFDILTSSPGNLIVHLALAMSVWITLQGALVQRRFSEPGLAGRMVLGVGAILLGQMVLFAFSGLAWQGIYDPRVILPPLDRAVTAWSLVWIAWLFSSSSRSPLADSFAGLLSLIVIILFLFTYTEWSVSNLQQTFNSNWYDWGWGLFSVFVILLGILYLSIKRPEGWGIGLAVLMVNLAGNIAHVLVGSAESDYAAMVRLAQLISYPMLPSLVQRFNTFMVEPETPPVHVEAEVKRRYTADPRTVNAWMRAAVETDREKNRQLFAQAFAQTMLADLCFLVEKPVQGGDITFDYGYDLIRDEEMPKTTLKQADIPNLSGAILRGRSIRLGDSGTVGPDLQQLSQALSLEKPGNLLSIPLVSGDQNWGSIILLSPYSGRVWSAADQNYLLCCIGSILHLLDRQPGPVLVEPTTATEQVEKIPVSETSDLIYLTDLVTQLQEENQMLTARLDQSNNSRQTMEIDSLLVIQQESQEVIRQLREENDRLRSTLDSAGEHPQLKQTEAELRAALKEIAQLQNGVGEANIKILEMENHLPKPDDRDLDEVMLSTIQELRQPITSIIGYTDLIMAETVGLLGTLQRKFLERVRASAERMRSLLDDLIRITIIEKGKYDIPSDMVDTAAVIDAAINTTRGQIQEKGITLSLDLPDELPQVEGDQDAIEQIMVHLLQNATSVTPPDGGVLFRAALEEEDEQAYLLLQITDSGGGISAEDMPRIFFRHFRAESPLIQGVGDKSIGLSIAKVLVEAHGGRIWVDSIPNESATFTVLIPTRQVNNTSQYTANENPA
jgi:signal transduction histidine kinase